MSMSNEIIDSDSESGSGSSYEYFSDDEMDVSRDCVTKVKLPANLAAYIEKRELLRDEETLPCDSELAEKVMTNYIIAKRILSYVSWQDKLLCKHVCSTWRSAINALGKERLYPVDFVYDVNRRQIPNGFFESDQFYNQPMAVFTFINACALAVSMECVTEELEEISPTWTELCNPACENKAHCVLDLINQYICGPKTCMLTVVTSGFTFFPLPTSDTEECSPTMPFRKTPFFSGICIPCIPDVKFHVLNIKQRKENAMDLKTDFYDEIEKLSKDRIFKGVLVFVTEKYILHSVEDVMLLNYFKQVQPDIPYALGGCLVEDTLFGQQEIEDLIEGLNHGQDYVSKDLISVALFTVPKLAEETQRDRCNFEMYSVVITRSEWSKEKIKQAITEFAKKVPTFEYSIALKLSCVGRNKKHIIEQDLFRAAFPDTPIIGCYGNGELGINHPPRDPEELSPSLKRPKKDSPQKESLMYSYSTVFVYMGWGKILSEPQGSKKT